MAGPAVSSSDSMELPSPPPVRLYERLRQIPGYTWDEARSPVHSTYDSWHVFGSRYISADASSTPSPHNASSPSSVNTRVHSGRHSGSDLAGFLSTPDQDGSSSATPVSLPTQSTEVAYIEQPVIARVSYHSVREERAFQIAKSVIQTLDPEGDHVAEPIDILRLAPQPGDRTGIIVAIYHSLGVDLLKETMDMGPAFYKAQKSEDGYTFKRKAKFDLTRISLKHFLDFAIGATHCLEMLHHGKGMIHGEIRGDAFHFHAESNKVRIVSFGSGVRSFENGLTSTGWSALSKELGAKNKLLYISPEQTGRMPAEPDSRTDIYSLGILFWTLLTQQPVFEGDSPLDIVQGVLGKRIPNVSMVRMDVPDVIGRIIQKCTAKNVADRYHSASGLRYDLTQVQQYLADGKLDALVDLKIGSNDVSSFFMLPTQMIGRSKERQQLINIVDRVAKTYNKVLRKTAAAGRFWEGSALSTDPQALDDVSSEGASSQDGTTRRSGSLSQTPSLDHKQPRNSFHPSILSETQLSAETLSSGGQSGGAPRNPRPWDRHPSISMDSRSQVDSGARSVGDTNRFSIAESGSTSLSRQLRTAKFRRRGRCEVVLIEGAGGLGKTFLVTDVMVEARRRGYCATAKFDTARRTAFGPLLKLLSSLFRQVWGERNTETPFHQGLKQYIRPVWPVIHPVLGLPEFLLGAPDPGILRSMSTSTAPLPHRAVGRPGLRRRGSSPGSSPVPGSFTSSGQSQSSQDFLRAGASTKSMRLMNIFLDILRVFTAHKFICFCVDDLHFADDESLELISQIINSRMNMLVIMTYRPEEMSSEKMQMIIEPPELDNDFARGNGSAVTRVVVSPLSEDDIVEYVAATMCRPKYEVLSLALVIQSKTAGNPFYMREMLSACHRKRCIWYDYRDARWNFSLDKLFDQFQGEKNYDVLDTSFITRRLDELPAASRSLLAWAALLGNSFSFELVRLLMQGEFDYHDHVDACDPREHQGYSDADCIAGLQAAVQAYIIMQSETDDRFRFAHDRYIHAAAALKECNARKMHFIIAQNLLKHYSGDSRVREPTAMHICESIDIIKKRVRHRKPYRDLLIDCAQSATQGSARPTAAKYYGMAADLLQEDPWTEGPEDVSYAETMQLFLRTAECHLFMGQHVTASDILAKLFTNAKTALDKAPAYVLQSRIYSESGASDAALASLKECLLTLGVVLEETVTWERCDDKFKEIATRVESVEPSTIVNGTQSTDLTLASIGAVLSETVAAAWWSDCLRFYYLSLVMMDMHFSRGAFPHSGLSFLNFGTIALSRFNRAKLAVTCGNISQDLLYQAQDSFSLARGMMLYPIFIGHVHQSVETSISQLAHAVEHSSLAGDRTSTIMSYGLTAVIKFFASDNVADLEGFCQYGCEEIPDWHVDTRGGALLLAVRQMCRALQGKTKFREPYEIMSDQHHDAVAYKSWLTKTTLHSNRSTLLYETLEIIPLFLYGHYDRAVEVGRRCHDNLAMLWSARNSRLVYLFYGLSMTCRLLKQMQDPRSQSESFAAEVEIVLQELKRFVHKIEEWTTISNVNYLTWQRLLQAQIFELSGLHGDALEQYEEGLDHASEHHFLFEEALGNYLMAGFLMRRKGRRSARSALVEAVGLYRQFAASGVASAIEEEHSLLLHGPMRHHWTSDAGVQTDFVADAPGQYRAVGGDVGEELTQMPSNTLAEVKGERIGAWRGSMNMEREEGAGLPALDMIDLHAILVSSQVISSMLNVDGLLKTMCDVILQTCGGSATLAAIVVQESSTDNWCVAALGDPEKGASAHNPGLPLSGTSLIAENVVLYCTRFLEAVFIPDLITDERFGNVTETWLQRNPVGKAIIAIPICQGNKPLLGVLYLEGEPNSFTDRNVTVLQLLVNQIGISYSNALAMKNVEKISAENLSMVDIQKEALDKAIRAEAKAKHAEAEAKRNVKLAEEAAKAKSIFLANVSHELRTPLNGVIGNSELLRDSSLNREQMEMADSIRVSADLLLTVINDILDFSKMEADKMKLYIIAFNPEEMVREVVRAVSYSNREKTSKKNVKIIQDIDLPRMLIYGDPIRLHQVLGNLIGNSLKFTEDGSITIGARLDSDTKKKAVLTFWVRDTGIGIPPQQLAKLFQPFSQADASTARKYGGSGLGLSICKSLIEIMMNGKIQLESEETVGTTAWFTVSFDKADPDVSAGDAQSQSHSPPPIDRGVDGPLPVGRTTSPDLYLDLSHIPKEDIRICVAEDNPINQKIAIQYVQRLGYSQVTAYENGLKAVEGLRQAANAGNPYHIVLMDVQMPVLDGYEATKLIRKDGIEAVRKILVIAMTASAIQGDREKCLAAGMNDYLAKPVRSEVLKKKLDAYTSPVNSTSRASVGHGTSSNQSQPPPSSSDKHTYNNSTLSESVNADSNRTGSLNISRKPVPGIPDNIVSDPIQEEAVFNRPLDGVPFNVNESPSLADELSSKSRKDGVDSLSQITEAMSLSESKTPQTQPKRRSRKLTRHNSGSRADAKEEEIDGTTEGKKSINQSASATL